VNDCVNDRHTMSVRNRNIKTDSHMTIGKWQEQGREQAARRRSALKAAAFDSSRVRALPLSIEELRSRCAYLTTAEMETALASVFLPSTSPDTGFAILSILFDPFAMGMSAEQRLSSFRSYPIVEYVVHGLKQPVNVEGSMPVLAAGVLEAIATDPCCARLVWEHALQPHLVLMSVLESCGTLPQQALMLPAIGQLLACALPSADAMAMIPRLIAIASAGDASATSEAMSCLLIAARALGSALGPSQLQCFEHLFMFANFMVTTAPWCLVPDISYAAVMLLIDLASVQCPRTKTMLCDLGIYKTAETLLKQGDELTNCAVYIVYLVLMANTPTAVSLFLNHTDMVSTIFGMVFHPEVDDDDCYFAMKSVRNCFPSIAWLSSEAEEHVLDMLVSLGGIEILSRANKTMTLTPDDIESNIQALTFAFVRKPYLQNAYW